MNSLKESPLAGKTKRVLHKLRRQMIKPSLLFKFAKLENVARDSAKLFGDKIPESLTHWQEYKIKFFVENKTIEGFG